jgi:exopolysaccharide biosynthesis protein
MKRKLTKKAKILLSTVIVFILLLGSLAYIAADRFLIEHVEAVVVRPLQAGTTGSGSEDYTATDTSYTSDTTKITVTAVTSDSGSDRLVYYVADIQLTDATDLKSAFAKDKYGTNIIQYVSAMAENNGAILAINGDYYGFRSDGIIIRNGVMYRDEPAREARLLYGRHNEGLRRDGKVGGGLLA